MGGALRAAVAESPDNMARRQDGRTGTRNPAGVRGVARAR